MISLDVAATCVALAGIDPIKELDGVNLIPFLNGNSDENPHDFLYWRFWDQYAGRMGGYKYLKWQAREFLFNLKSDIGEKKNLINEFFVYPFNVHSL